MKVPRQLVTVSASALAASTAALGVLAAQAWETKRRIGPRRTVPPYADGRYGVGEGTSIRLAVLGDSGAAGLGASHPDETMGVVLARGLSELSARTVVLSNHAVVGAQTKDLPDQITRALWTRPHVAMIMIGANDLTHGVPLPVSARRLRSAVARLREAGTQVVVATCPDLGSVQPIPQPLRAVARRRSRALARAQREATVQAGGRTVALGDLLGPEFTARPDVMFAADRFHPSPAGYEAAAQALLPEVLAAWRLGEVGEYLPSPTTPSPS
jgi:lysophospholipase L1-like esterase